MSQNPKGWNLLDLSDLAATESDFITHSGPLYINADRTHPRIIAFEVAPHMCNVSGVCHGGMLMMAMDIALGFALIQADEPIRALPTISLNVDFLAPAPLGTWLEVEAQTLKRTKSTGFATGQCLAENNPVAAASGVFKISRPK